ncbi:helix-turn-helix domain-containing protein [Hoyosella altamirensis]|uniref:Transposase-like protein n=1 Tax=Hoyosella altamirensis TaxID=616997 RepID=A0A839RVD5_9ACTN|nr:helix-turn-helix domain-containing protein [Hoyosella altamirensis]MBB3039422.1 transposase-like protein [Hoyosella altamirensis]MBB3039994.1 transposase-like protein [Hoyosella altamirensis]
MNDLVLTASEARALTDRIKTGVEAIWELIKQAYQSRAWDALGYASWDDYCTREFGTSRIRLPREERQEVVASMREIGMSTRAIASATGDHYSTISRELGRVANATPDPQPVTGTDGKTYLPRSSSPLMPQTDLDELNQPNIAPGMTADELNDMRVTEQPDPTGNADPQPVKPKRRPITDAFDEATYELKRATERITRLTTDDRMKKNTDQIVATNLTDLIRARDALNGVITTLEG